MTFPQICGDRRRGCFLLANSFKPTAPLFAVDGSPRRWHPTEFNWQMQSSEWQPSAYKSNTKHQRPLHHMGKNIRPGRWRVNSCSWCNQFSRAEGCKLWELHRKAASVAMLPGVLTWQALKLEGGHEVTRQSIQEILDVIAVIDS